QLEDQIGNGLHQGLKLGLAAAELVLGLFSFGDVADDGENFVRSAGDEASFEEALLFAGGQMIFEDLRLAAVERFGGGAQQSLNHLGWEDVAEVASGVIEGRREQLVDELDQSAVSCEAEHHVGDGGEQGAVAH